MANPFDRFAIELCGADRKAAGRIGRAKLRMRHFSLCHQEYCLILSLRRRRMSKDARQRCSGHFPAPAE
jgi:hypothetical protein